MIRIIWETSDGDIIKGLTDCPTPSSTSKKMVDTDLNHGTINPGDTSLPKVVAVRTFSWINNGDPNNSITGAGLYIDQYYSTGPTYTADSGKSFCNSASTAVFGDYNDAGGSHSPSSDISNLLTWGDDGYGVQVSLDRGSSYTTFKTGQGDSVSNAINLAATSMDIGSVDGQLEPGDRSVLYFRISVPSTFNDVDDAGVYLFSIGMKYSYTE